MIAFWKRIIRIFSEAGIFCKIETWEWIFYGILLIVSLGLMVFVFAHTQGFYGTDVNFNIIYSSNSPYLVKNNAYMTLTNSENDIRQPVFAVFASPFIGIPYLFGKILNAGPSLNAILVNSVQIIMLFAANLMLAKMIKLNPVKRACFMLLFYSTHTNMLFTLMMEQYIVAYFWLALFVYLISEKQQQDHIAMWGAGGTLLTGIFFVPFFSSKSFVKDFKGWFMDTVKAGCGFVAVILVFCRFDVIYNLTARISFLGEFTGRNLSLMEKVFQYTQFVLNYFTAPDAGPNTITMDYITWQMNPVTGISFAGIAILFLAVISFILNRNKKSSLLSVCWIGFSVIILVSLGWGTKENGLILYELYFGWAILILLFQLIEKIEDMLKIKCILPVVSICIAGTLFVINIPAVIEMIYFTAAFYPV